MTCAVEDNEMCLQFHLNGSSGTLLGFLKNGNLLSKLNDRFFGMDSDRDNWRFMVRKML